MARCNCKNRPGKNLSRHVIRSLKTNIWQSVAGRISTSAASLRKTATQQGISILLLTELVFRTCCIPEFPDRMADALMRAAEDCHIFAPDMLSLIQLDMPGTTAFLRNFTCPQTQHINLGVPYVCGRAHLVQQRAHKCMHPRPMS